MCSKGQGVGPCGVWGPADCSTQPQLLILVECDVPAGLGPRAEPSQGHCEGPAALECPTLEPQERASGREGLGQAPSIPWCPGTTLAPARATGFRIAGLVGFCGDCPKRLRPSHSCSLRLRGCLRLAQAMPPCHTPPLQLHKAWAQSCASPPPAPQSSSDSTVQGPTVRPCSSQPHRRQQDGQGRAHHGGSSPGAGVMCCSSTTPANWNPVLPQNQSPLAEQQVQGRQGLPQGQKAQRTTRQLTYCHLPEVALTDHMIGVCEQSRCNWEASPGSHGPCRHALVSCGCSPVPLPRVSRGAWAVSQPLLEQH